MGTVLFLVGALGCALLSVVLIRKRWRFTDTPTSDAAHVFPGLSEVHGTVEAIGQAAKAASDGAPCVSGAETNDIEHLSLDFLRPYARVMKDTDAAAAQVVARVEATPSLNTNPNVAQLMARVTPLPYIGDELLR